MKKFIDLCGWNETDQHQHFLFTEELCSMIKWCRNGDTKLFREFVEEAIGIMKNKDNKE